MRPIIKSAPANKIIISLGIIFSFIYLSWWLNFANADNLFLYNLLFAGEIFHVFLAILFFYNSWPKKRNIQIPSILRNYPSVNVFITVAGEPADVVAETVREARRMDYPNFKIYILNDGKAAGKENWREVEKLASDLKVGHIARDNNKGFKAGNINNALKKTDGEIVVIFDADMVPSHDFLVKVIPHFRDEKVGFVQTPQYYKNYSKNEITKGAWEQQEFFFGPIMKGKDKAGAAFICGTNVAIRRSALLSAGGMVEDNIAEDFVTSLIIHKKWKSVYVDEVLAQGLAPEDPLSYYKQQLRWARGSLEVLFKHNPLFIGGLSFGQRIEYLASTLFYLNGIFVVIDAAMPLLFLYFGLQPVKSATSDFAFYFFPFIALILMTMYSVSNGSISLKGLSFSFSSWELQLKALFSILTGKKIAFAVTPKTAQKGSFAYLVYPHYLYIFLFLGGTVFGLLREGLSPAITTNLAWSLFNTIFFIPFINAVNQKS